MTAQRRVPVALIAYGRRDQRMDIAELMVAYTLSEAEVLAALLYYAENRDAIDAYEEAYAAASIGDWIAHGNDSFLPNVFEFARSSGIIFVIFLG